MDGGAPYLQLAISGGDVEQGQTVVYGGGVAGELRVGGEEGVQVAELHRAEQVVLLAAVAAAAEAVAHRGRRGKVLLRCPVPAPWR